MTESILLFWVMPSLISLLCCIEASRFIDNEPPEALNTDQWVFYCLICIFWPISAVALVLEWFLPMLTKEREISSRNDGWPGTPNERLQVRA